MNAEQIMALLTLLADLRVGLSQMQQENALLRQQLTDLQTAEPGNGTTANCT